LKEHSRPPAFEGLDAQPYTVSIEVERTGNLRTPFRGFLVFPRWAETGLGIVGHVETDMLADGRSQEDVEARLGALTLDEVKRYLDDAIQRSQDAL